MWWSVLVLVVAGVYAADVSPLEQEAQRSSQRLDAETRHPDVPHSDEILFSIQNQIKLFLQQQRTHFNVRLDALEGKMEQLCTGNKEENQSDMNSIDNVLNVKIAEMMDLFIGKLSTLVTKVEEVERKVNSLSSDVLNSMENKLSPLNDHIIQVKQSMSSLAAQNDLLELKSKLSTLVSTTTSDLKQSLASLATLSHVSDHTQQLDARLTEVRDLLTDGCVAPVSENTNILNQVLNSVTLNKESIDGLSTTQQAGVTQCLDHHTQAAGNITGALHDLKDLAMNNNRNLDTLSSTLQEVTSDLKRRLTALEGTVSKIDNNTQPPTSTTTTTTTTTPLPPTTLGPLTPCEDSTFIGSSSTLSVCSAAVRFKKCRLQFVAFHCCSSCTADGQIPAMGSWRYLNYPRTVTILQALNYMRP
nr:bromodomain-containing protein DDB_G0280777-like [Procambarus clarkii]